MPSPVSGRVRVLEAAPELGEGLTPEEFAAALPAVAVPAFDLEPGSWSPDALHEASISRGSVVANLVVDGLLALDLKLGRQASTHLYGPGDVLRVKAPDFSSLPLTVAFTVHMPTRIALLDDTFLAATQRWPRMTECLVKRATDQILHLTVDQAISQLPRVEDRLLALMWRLADRWGRRRGDDVVVSLAITHDALGRLIGARRPTVSLGLTTLRERGALHVDERGDWILAADSIRHLEARQSQ